MPTRRHMPRSSLKDLLIGQFPDSPTVTVAILTFNLVHFNDIPDLVSELGTSPHLSVDIFWSQSASAIKNAVDGMMDSPRKLKLVSKLVCLPTWPRRHMNP